MRTILIFIVTFYLFACVATEKASTDFLLLLNSKRGIPEDKINFEGGYHIIRQELYNYPLGYKEGKSIGFVSVPYLDRPIFFFDNGFMCYDQLFTLDSIQFNTWMLKYGEKKWTSLVAVGEKKLCCCWSPDQQL